jgi:methylated-DNA-[protein]-cysteine S-methyltransferase
MDKATQDLELNYHYFSSPLGWILVAAGSKGICLLHFLGPSAPSQQRCKTVLSQTFSDIAVMLHQQNPLLNKAEGALLKYLHDRQPMPPFPLELLSGTSFQHQVWKALCGIPFGETRSYLQVAQAIDKPQSPRAVGQACGKNFIPILIPCHRVISAEGRLGGFSGGLHIKQALLKIEGVHGFA